MEARIVAGVVATTAVVFSIGAATPAAAEGNNQVIGIEQTVGDPNGMEIAYTVSKILPSADPVAYPVAGQLYEATVMARALQGTVVPSVPSFSAHAGTGATYPALAGVSSLSGAPLWDGATTDGKVYFDVVGDVPDSVVFSDGPVNLAWAQPMAGGSVGGSGGGSAGGSGGVSGSTGPMDASPSTSGGEIGGGEGGTEGGGGNLSSGGGSGAPNGDTGGGGGNASGGGSGG